MWFSLLGGKAIARLRLQLQAAQFVPTPNAVAIRRMDCVDPIENAGANSAVDRRAKLTRSIALA